MSENFTSTKFWMSILVIILATIFVAFGIGTFDAWAFYTTGVLGIYSGANTITKYLQK